MTSALLEIAFNLCYLSDLSDILSVMPASKGMLNLAHDLGFGMCQGLVDNS
jgi:hypothetical protein